MHADAALTPTAALTLTLADMPSAATPALAAAGAATGPGRSRGAVDYDGVPGRCPLTPTTDAGAGATPTAALTPTAGPGITTLLRTAQREWGILDRVPFIRLAKESRGRLRTFSLGEEELVQATLRGYVPPKQSRNLLERRRGAGFDLYGEAADLFTVLIDTGMRLGEAVKLESRDCSMETGLIHVWESKGGTPRSIPMTSRVRGILGARADRQRAFQLTCSDAEGVFRRRIKPIPGFEDTCWHIARHTFASRLVTLGVPLYSVQKLLGHSSSKMTERYSHLAPESFRAAANLLDSLRNTESDGNADADASVVVADGKPVTHNGISSKESTQPAVSTGIQDASKGVAG